MCHKYRQDKKGLEQSVSFFILILNLSKTLISKQLVAHKSPISRTIYYLTIIFVRKNRLLLARSPGLELPQLGRKVCARDMQAAVCKYTDDIDQHDSVFIFPA